MKIYVVGGAVRDELLGLPVQDRDYVVVGATPEHMLSQGFRPVGKDFPVFLHPGTQEEYALARTERKVAPGYQGFVFHTDNTVTLEQDLARRDLTVNAMAKDEDGVLIDPYNGREDLHRRVLRHVSDAFVEDPVRILRIARFAARFADFTVAPETNALMQDMVRAGEVDALVPERVWQELARGMMEKTPSRMFSVLRDCAALARILPELDALWGVPQPARYHPEIDTGVHVMMALDYAASRAYSLGVRFSALMHDLGKGTTPPAHWPSHHGHEGRSVELLQGICDRLKIPNDCRDLAIITAREHGNVGHVFELRPATIVNLLVRCDSFRKPGRFREMLLASECDWRGRIGFETVGFPQLGYLIGALEVARGVDTGAIAGKYKEQPERIPEAILAARTEAVAAYVAATRQDRE
ncbi:MAG: multifunctional CCA addition/repair protein [Herbaspirillum sp.]